MTTNDKYEPLRPARNKRVERPRCCAFCRCIWVDDDDKGRPFWQCMRDLDHYGEQAIKHYDDDAPALRYTQTCDLWNEDE